MSTPRIAIVTGASRGIGAGIALALAQQGISIALIYTSASSQPKASEVASQIRALGQRAILIQADLSRPDCGEVVLRETLKGFETDRVDILVNNAGVSGVQSSLEVGVGEFERIIAVNTLAPILLVKSIVPHMRRGGRIISISSILAHEPHAGYDSYVASKAAIEGLTRQWAITFGKTHGITANAIICGTVGTDIISHLGEEVLEPIRERAAAGHRIGTPDDLGQVVAFLAGEGARWVTGQCIGVHGGVLFN